MRHGKSLLTDLKFGSAAKSTASSERDTSRQINDYQPKAGSGFTGLKFGSSAKKQLNNERENNSDPAKAPEPVWLKGAETPNEEKPLNRQGLVKREVVGGSISVKVVPSQSHTRNWREGTAQTAE